VHVGRFPGDPGRGRVYVGTTVPPDQPVELAPTDALRITMTRRFYRRGQAWRLVRMAAQDSAAGLLPLVSFKPPGRWADVAAGRHDGILRWILVRLRDIERPVMLAIHHEPENEASRVQRPRDWVAMQTHVIGLAGRLSPNVTIVPVLMQYTFDPASGRNPREWLVPDAVVRGVDVYNPWRPRHDAPWVELGTMLDRVRKVMGPGPLVVPEFGCHTDPHDHARTLRWFSDAFDYAVDNDVVGMTYFDSPHSKDGESWVLDPLRRSAMQHMTRRVGVTGVVD
jgi:hypothetical protein